MEQHRTGLAPLLTEARYSRRQVMKLVAGGTALGLGTTLVGGHHFAMAQATPETDLSAYPVVTISAENDGDGYKFVVPDSLPTGLVMVGLDNQSDAEHHAVFLLPNADTTADALADAVKNSASPADFVPLSVAVGGPGSVSPGQKTSVIMNLDEGSYVLICEVPGPDGTPHYKMGMVEVVEAKAGDSPVTTQPTTGTTVDLVDFAFDGLPASMPAGQYVWEVTNTGQEPHEMIVEKLSPGVTADAAYTMLTGEATGATPDASAEAAGPPFIAVAGSAPMDPGYTVWSILDLDASDYVTVCFIPDPATGKPHIMLGMFGEFTVE